MALHGSYSGTSSEINILTKSSKTGSLLWREHPEGGRRRALVRRTSCGAADARRRCRLTGLIQTSSGRQGQGKGDLPGSAIGRGAEAFEPDRRDLQRQIVGHFTTGEDPAAELGPTCWE
jgi:hypothetical protein